MKYLIACDLDGSLLNHQGDITDQSMRVINALRQDGHIVVIATGRPYEGAIAKYRQLNLDTPMITDNGGSIENPSDHRFAIQKTYIPNEIVKALFAFSKPFVISSFFSDNRDGYAYQYDPKLEQFFSGLNSEHLIETDFSDLTVEPTGLIYLIQSDEMLTFENHIDLKYSQIISYRLWGSENGIAIYEVYLKHISKSSALNYLLDYYGMKKEQLIAIGDGINDVEMIRDAHWGVAMINGFQEVKDVSNDMTKYTNNADGLALYLKAYFNLEDI